MNAWKRLEFEAILIFAGALSGAAFGF